MDGPEAWGIGIGAGWEYRASSLIDEACRSLGVTRKRLAPAIGFGKDLTVSALKASGPRRLRECVLPHNVPVAAYALQRDLSKYRRLERFMSALAADLGMGEIDYATARAGRREALDWGYVGVELFDAGRWDVALPYLDAAWKVLAGRTELGSDRAVTHAALRVGAQLLGYDGYVGCGRGTLSMLSRLRSLVPPTAVKSMDRSLVYAAACFYNSAATAFWHLGTMSGRSVAAYAENAQGIFAALPKKVPLIAAAARDQAKPLIRDAMREADLGKAEALVARARAKLTCAIDSSGGREAEEGMQAEWFFSMLTKTECEALLGNGDQARSLLDLVRNARWIGSFLSGKAHTPALSKYTMTELAVLASQGDLDSVVERATAFVTDPRQSPYTDRIRKGSAYLRYAETGDSALFREAILGQPRHQRAAC